MDGKLAEKAAELLLDAWARGARIDALPEDRRPRDRAAGYAVAEAAERVSGDRVAGWKIAATSAAGQKHINVDGPLAGRIFAKRLLSPDAPVPLAGNAMRVAEAEFCFVFGRDLPVRATPYGVAETMDAVADLRLAIETPDSRFTDFTAAGAPSLIADAACASWLTLGPPVAADWRRLDLSKHAVLATKNGAPAGAGGGFNVLGDPRAALAWLVNEMAAHGRGMKAGEFVTTGTSIVPVPIGPGDVVEADFGGLGKIAVLYE